MFGFIVVAVGNVKDSPLFVENRDEKMQSMTYIHGYEKKAKSKNLGAAAAGWLTWGAIFLILVL